ncbi:hypothetical protein LH604_28210, partial [Klebsiella pneumoniae]|uniref:hypothetical protein n=1 Tax=Klebsiella pneumoniae TaxID=573 RepID=UPI001E63D662
REMFSWAIQSELIEVLGTDDNRAMALAYVLCEHHSTRAFVIVAPHDPESPDGTIYPDQIVAMPPLNPKMSPNKREQATYDWVTEALEDVAGVTDAVLELNPNLASLDNAALAEQAHALITELTARLENPVPAALMQNEELH